MKKQNLFFLILLSALTLGACDKYLGGSSNLVGTWDIYSITQNTYTNGSLDSSNVQNDMGTFSFNSGGDGNYSVKNGEETNSGTFDWFEQNDKVFINMLNLTDSIMTKNLAVGFDVVTNTATQQVWSLSFSYYEKDENPTTGATVNYLKKTYIEMDLRKQ
ncbi:MAG: hypothetical protein D4R64_18210 [Porphyromonadaceae bacterium]|nr:MAG: hypothetical protein D4R64_18210 [Porphyromonadaceae bacterium]